ncbi:twin-arginine translocation pathway signal protein (plasmid) [Leptolyngbya sp. BL0902]|uniref:sulfatase-like hydrolase/transferase n=1 Tax=Leptolyngbya sp. BL0902 TaxID=1115757 RepID=UPI0018E70802|nr:sulfatase-like hydrolase/transferase [Leptolyngbya sp. BL0902]QQE67517.1 twin-arginine translocation pathway signal protein [Leptolyngbya sp. BL0902]
MTKDNQGPYNIVFILTDQERHFRPDELPKGYHLPAHERLAKNGVVFENHRINSCVCTSSRSVIYTGLHIQQTKMFDNTNFPWMQSMSTDIKTLGHQLREAGYYTAYKGKWHLTREFETDNTLEAPTKIFTQEMEAYGFADYLGVGDIIAHTQGGYLHDGMIAAAAASWLRGKASELAQENKPWFLAVNLVNPHDVMFYDTDEPGQPMQGKNNLTHIAGDPAHEMYAKQWDFDLPESFSQPLDAPGRPAAHTDHTIGNNVMTGPIPVNETWRWRKRHNFYLNALRDVDRHILTVLDELEDRGLASNTIVILTADHGELGGAHQMTGKGATSYREQNNVPLIVAHPAYPGGKRCRAVTTHLDLAPTLISFTNVSPDTKAAITKDLPGKDFSPVLANPEQADIDTVRDGQLFCFNMFAMLDGDFLLKAQELLAQGGPEKIKEAGLRPDMTKRGTVRSVFDGRYQFTRYFSPKQHNRPTTMEELFELNDVELFDHQNDPHEVDNLALDREKNADLIMAMNAKLNRLIDEEVGEDIGQMLPGGVDGGWVATPAVHDL